jgi:glutathione S-transferase
MINCYAFGSVPPLAQGLVKDLRVRWALEEAGLPYRITLVGDGPGQVARDAYRKVQPFGQIPAIEDGDLTLFESGAIVQYVAERSEALWPRARLERTRVVQWMFCALNTMEMPIQYLALIDLVDPSASSAKERRPAALDWVRARLAELAACLDGRNHLMGDFSAADILMTSVLRILRHTDLVDEQPVLAAYKARCEARPAFQKSLGDQMEVFRAAS